MSTTRTVDDVLLVAKSEVPRRVRYASNARCSVDGCDGMPCSKGLCNFHRRRKLTGIPLDRPRRVIYAGMTCSVDGCDKRPKRWGLCNSHSMRAYKGKDTESPITEHDKNGRWKEKDGYILIRVPIGYPGSRLFGPKSPFSVIFEHRLVVQELLGRTLHPEESIHHVNGVKSDNRIENLELWSRRHHSGQRVADKVAYAIEILALYPEFTGLDLVDRMQLGGILDKVKLGGTVGVARRIKRNGTPGVSLGGNVP